MIVRFVMLIQVQWVDSNGRMDFGVVRSSISRNFSGKTWRRALTTILRRRSSVWRKIVVKMTFDLSAIGNLSLFLQWGTLISRNFVGVRRFWRNFLENVAKTKSFGAFLLDWSGHNPGFDEISWLIWWPPLTASVLLLSGFSMDGWSGMLKIFRDLTKFWRFCRHLDFGPYRWSTTESSGPQIRHLIPEGTCQDAMLCRRVTETRVDQKLKCLFTELSEHTITE